MYTLSGKQRREFALRMKRIDEFCKRHHILKSRGSDAYFFAINGRSYVIANRRRKVPQGTIFILASKTRIMKIYEDLACGIQLDVRGNIKDNSRIKEDRTC